MKRIPDEFLKQLEKRVDLRNVLPKGTYLCPWHEDKRVPNLHIYPDHAYCFACGKYADSIEAIQWLYKDGARLPFQEAIWVMQQHAGDGVVRKDATVVDSRLREWIEEYQDNLWHNDEAMQYLFGRGITSPNLIHDLNLGCTVGRGNKPFAITIPHYDKLGSPCNLKFRILPEALERTKEEGKKLSKYWSLPDHKFHTLYPQMYVDAAFTSKARVVITEGEFDAIILLQHNVPALSLPSGVNSAWPLNELPYEVIWIAFDMDEAGERTAEKWCSMGRYPNMKRMRWDKTLGKDVTEYMLARERQAEESWR